MTGVPRTYWHGRRLNYVAPEPLLLSLLKYRRVEDRLPMSVPDHANLVSSKTRTGKQAPIIDLDIPHKYVPSTTPGHAHLYLNVEISRWRWIVLMCALRLAGVIELGTFAWSLRRGANFVRTAGTRRTFQEAMDARPPVLYGWLRRIK